MHWLSEKPCEIESHVHMVGASAEEHAVFSARAEADWLTILQHRLRELKPGGRAVFVNFCRDAAGHYLGNTGGVNMFDTLRDIWHEFVADGVINSEELARMTLPAQVVCPYAAQFQADADLETFASGLIGTIRSWNQSVFLGALDGSRSPDERHAIIEDYYEAYRVRVLDNPTGHGMDYVHAYMTVVKDS